MELTHRFTVPAPVDVAWATFNDLDQVAPCFPGAALTSYDGQEFAGLVKVKLGPISLQYTGTGRFVERDETAHQALVEAKGKDKRGNGTAAATVRASLERVDDDQTAVIVVTELNITGRPAQFGRGVMQDVSDKLLAQFAACLESKLGEPTAPSAAAADPEPAATTGTEPAAAMGTEPAVSADTEPAPPSGSEPPGPVAAGAFADVAEELVAPPDPAPPGPDPARQAAPAAAAPSPVALDLGVTVLPILLKRFAPQLVGAVLGLWLVRRVFRRLRGRGRRTPQEVAAGQLSAD